MESASHLLPMPFQKTLRSGQSEVVASSLRPGVSAINAQLPTGYGKTFTACCVYAALQQIGRVNRLLYIVPTTAQLSQFVTDGAGDLVDAGVSGPLGVVDVTYVGAIALKHHRQDKAQVFATTIQALASGRAWETIVQLMETGRWMVVIDEYHHYGIDKHWGRQVSKLNYVFRLALSATPYRPDDDGAFGPPDVKVEYLRAVEEKAVKPLRLHSYVYRVDLIEADGGVVSYTTEQLAAEAGSDSPEAIDKMVLDRKMRWSPKYVSPLVDRPIARMQRERIRTGYPFQVLVGAMSCAHAELVCGQLRAMFPELRIDWVGTGANGRSDKDNAKIIAQFCPPKRNGKRRAEDVKLDVLVHVGMAGEGLDSIYVSEVVHLNRASINNSNNQENGRAARYLPDVIGYINVDSSSPYAPYIGESVMKLMDDPLAEPGNEEDAERDPELDPDQWPDIPDEPTIQIIDMECIRVDDGEVMRFGQEMLRSGGASELDIAAVFENPSHPNHDRWLRIAEHGYREMRKREAEQFNAMAEVAQWEEAVKSYVSTLTGQIVKRVQATGVRIEKSFVGDLKKRINTQKARALGPLERDLDVLKRHWHWLKNLEADLRKGEAPTWLL
jgi:superfamily II DNA or RNA helicase